MMGLTQSPFQDNGTATWRKWSKQVTETVQLFLISGWSTQSWTQRENMWRDRSEIPEREEIVNWNDMKDVFWTALATSDVDEHKYGSYPHKWNDKTPLIMIRNHMIFFFMLVVWKHLTNVNQASSVFFFSQNKQKQLWSCSPAACHFVCKQLTWNYCTSVNTLTSHSSPYSFTTRRFLVTNLDNSTVTEREPYEHTELKTN